MEFLDDDIEYDKDIPLRSDTLYKYIEGIPPYSLSQSVTFFMAIRNKEVIRLLEGIKKNPGCVAVAKVLHEKFGTSEESIEEYIPLEDILHIVKKDDHQYIKDVKVLYEKFGMNEKCIEAYFKLGFQNYNNTENIKYRCNSDGMPIISRKKIEVENIYTEEQDVKLNYVYCRKKNINNNIEFAKYKSGLKEAKLNYLNESFVSRKIPTLSLNNIEPELSLPNMRKVMIQFNSSLSREQLKDQFDTYLDALYCDDTIVKSPLEQLRTYMPKENENKFKNLNKGLKKKTNKSNEVLADKFFVYDAITARIEICQKLNSEAEDNYKNEIKDIESSSLSKDHKKELINDLNKSDNSIIPCKITDYFIEISKLLGKKKTTISNHYYQMRTFIDDMEYKRLVSDT